MAPKNPAVPDLGAIQRRKVIFGREGQTCEDMIDLETKAEFEGVEYE